MGRKLGSKNKKIKTTTNRNKNTNINNVHVHVEKPITRKKRTTKPKTEQIKTPVLNPFSALSRGTSQNLGFHPVGLVDNQMQQPTVIQQIIPAPDPRLEKLEKRTKKIKEYLKGKGDTKENPINVESPSFQDAFKTPAKADIFSDAIEPRRINFENAPNQTPKKGLLSRIFASSKKKEQKQEGLPLLEYKPPKHPATAPAFTQTESIETQTTPVPTGHQINQELKNLVNQMHAGHPNSKLHISTFRSVIAKKLKELGIDPQHTTTYVDKMRRFYDELYAASHGGEAAGGVM